MSENNAKTVTAVAKRPAASSASARLARLRYQLRTLQRLMNKAGTRVRETPGFRNKLKEIVWISRKAQKRMAKRLKLASAAPVSQTPHARPAALAVQRMALSTVLAEEAPLPACASTAGGVIVISVEGTTVPSVYLRDGAANIYQARIIDRHPLYSAAGEARATRLVVQPPIGLMDGGHASVDVVLRTQDEQVVFENVRIERDTSITVHNFRFENSCANFSGTCPDSSLSKLSIGLFVDGDLSASCTVSTAGTAFSGTIVLDHSHLDGRSHLLELRETSGMSLLASLYQVLPLHITPWNALQTYAGPPLDGTLSQQARHHFRSYRLWFGKLRNRGLESVPPLDSLYAELLKGFKKRAAYPKIAFETPTHPTVSVIVPVHNKCEVTYYCLCSLLFAFNHTSFEVIVVDDGSSDETTRLSEFVQGVQIVRHATAQGFVRACNAGAARARGEFILLLNNDTEVTARWLDELVAAFRNFDRVGLAGSKLVYPDGRLQEAGGVVWGSGNPWNVGRDGNPDDPRYNYLRKVDYVSGAALMVPRKLWQKVGGFSEEFAPAYFEDTDLAMKVRESGHFAVYVPTSTVYHFEGRSSGTSVATGMKAFQEVNRPKFRRKWAQSYRDHGREGEAVEREKDRHVAFRALFVDHQFPFVDLDAGSYAAFQEIRLFQDLGAKVTFLPRNLAWMDRHTTALQRIGVECLYAPYVMSFLHYVREHAAEYDVVYATRYTIAEQILPLVRDSAPRTKVVFNLADLHYLRELREAAAHTPGYSRAKAEATRRAELSAVRASDLTFSYSDAELEILRDQLRHGSRLARMPWVVECRKRVTAFSETRDILFLGGFSHPPNIQAVRFFADDVMPLICERLRDAVFNVIGSGARTKVAELMSDRVRIVGYVPSVAEPLDRTRVFVAPLFAGAGLKGKVLDAISHGVPCVLSPVAAEGIGLTHGLDCLIADSKEAWADCVIRLYTDDELWNLVSTNAFTLAQTRYSFAAGVSALESELARIGVAGRRDWGLAYRFTRPERYGT
ncbi:MAG TPA: glycosyltransferase [Rhizomicrobium sp.]|nr:glycosyltransferase [Rhizomicrobium sp.]